MAYSEKDKREYLDTYFKPQMKRHKSGMGKAPMSWADYVKVRGIKPEKKVFIKKKVQDKKRGIRTTATVEARKGLKRAGVRRKEMKDDQDKRGY